MKTAAIKRQIIENYKQLSKLAYVQSNKENVIHTWGIVYKHNRTSGYVNQMGDIKRNRSSIRIINKDELQLQKKPFYVSWERTLKNINLMLQNTIQNINNREIVTKKVVNIFGFSKETVERLSKLTRL